MTDTLPSCPMPLKEAGSTDTTYQTMNLRAIASLLDMPLNTATGTAIHA
ncbi:hypothetical protein [Fibrella arboris]